MSIVNSDAHLFINDVGRIYFVTSILFDLTHTFQNSAGTNPFKVCFITPKSGKTSNLVGRINNSTHFLVNGGGSFNDVTSIINVQRASFQIAEVRSEMLPLLFKMFQVDLLKVRQPCLNLNSA